MNTIFDLLTWRVRLPTYAPLHDVFLIFLVSPLSPRAVENLRKIGRIGELVMAQAIGIVRDQYPEVLVI